MWSGKFVEWIVGKYSIQTADQGDSLLTLFIKSKEEVFEYGKAKDIIDWSHCESMELKLLAQ